MPTKIRCDGRVRRWLRITAAVGIAYLGVLLTMAFFENALVYPARHYPIGDWETDSIGAQDVEFESADGTELHGWFFAHDNPRGHLLVFHGNGEHIADTRCFLQWLHDELQVSLFAIDYRGYGKSEGSPCEKGVLEDGEAALKWLTENQQIDVSEVIVVGRSLGGGVGVHLASRHPVGGLILVGTFHSLVEVAAHHYWFLPVRIFMKNRYASKRKIRNYHGPLLQFHATEDYVVPVRFARRLFDQAPSEHKTFVSLDGLGHNDPLNMEALQAMKDFIHSLDTATARSASP